MGKILITSALPYANGSIHIGHLVEYIQTDIFVRFLKLTGHDAIYCCADDAHGTPIEVNAKKQGLTPKQLIDKYYKEHIRDFKDFLVEFDSYHTTDSPENKKYAELIFSRLKEKGLIARRPVEQLYCEHCKRSLPDRFVRGTCPHCNTPDQYGDVCERCGKIIKATELIEPRCSICGKTPIKKTSDHYFFQLKKCERQLRDWLKNTPLQKEVKNYVMNWIEEGLEDWDISRDGPYFGFKIPGEEDKYFYVWLDAPIGYIASTENYCNKHNQKVEDYWNNPGTRIVHFIGKDIVYFHYLFWPAMLMSAGFNLPDDIVVHGFLTVNGEKMSKSRGTFFTAADFLKQYDPEYLRYYYAKLLSRHSDDLDLSFSDFKDKVNNELVANLGNFCHRCLSFVQNNFNSKVSRMDFDEGLITDIRQKIKNIEASYHNYDFRTAVRETMAISSLGNKYFQDNEPWKLVRENKQRAEAVLGLCCQIATNLSVLIRPVLPRFSDALQAQLGVKAGWKDIGFRERVYEIREAKPLIQKIGETERPTFPLDLKVASIESADDHPEADKLYVLKIDLGTEKRQLVAGLRPYFKKDQIKGQKIVVVTNLKPTKLRGVESNGMLLAGEHKGSIRLVQSDAEPGAQVELEGHDIYSQQIKIEDFMKIKLTSKAKHVVCQARELTAAGKPLTIELPDGAVIR
jgi:methionyl-tRNA synthetase